MLVLSAFVYVAAETLPVGLLPQISEGLSVSEAQVGLLLTSYAAVAALSTIPLTAITMRVPRHRLIAGTVAIFAVSQFAAALAPNFTVLTVARLLCALAHGVFWSTIAPVCAVTTVLVVGHFAAYTYIAPLVRRSGGLEGLSLSALLLGYGAAGLLGNLLVGRLVDRRPGPVLAGLVAAIAAGLALLALTPGPALTVIAVLFWGAAFMAVPICLQTAVLRVSPHTRDAASAVYVVAFQIGIGGGALLGERLIRAGQLGDLPVLGAGLALVSGAIVLLARRAFPLHLGPGRS